MTDLVFPQLAHDLRCCGSDRPIDAALACWLVADGRRVEVDEPVAEVRVGGRTVVIRALATGTLWHLCNEGEALAAGIPVAVVE